MGGIWKSERRSSQTRGAVLKRVCTVFTRHRTLQQAIQLAATNTAKLVARLCCYQHSSTFTENPVVDHEAEGDSFHLVLSALREHCTSRLPMHPQSPDMVVGYLAIFRELLVVSHDNFSRARVAAILDVLDSVVRHQIAHRSENYGIFVEEACRTLLDLAVDHTHVRVHLVVDDPTGGNEAHVDAQPQQMRWDEWLALFRAAQAEV